MAEKTFFWTNNDAVAFLAVNRPKTFANQFQNIIFCDWRFLNIGYICSFLRNKAIDVFYFWRNTTGLWTAAAKYKLKYILVQKNVLALKIYVLALQVDVDDKLKWCGMIMFLHFKRNQCNWWAI